MSRAAVRNRRIALAGGWLLLSAWQGYPIYAAFMAHSENRSIEVAVALALSVCWVPVVGTAAAIMCAVWAWGWPWWLGVALYLGPKVAYLCIARVMERRCPKPRAATAAPPQAPAASSH
ncbi:MAG: hypothetical protein U0625_09690 [Phycisphaerales bacterium]